MLKALFRSMFFYNSIFRVSINRHEGDLKRNLLTVDFIVNRMSHRRTLMIKKMATTTSVSGKKNWFLCFRTGVVFTTGF